MTAGNNRYIACFFDMLGQSAAYLKLKDINTPKEAIDAVVSKATETMAVAEHLRGIVADIESNPIAIVGQLKRNAGTIFESISVDTFVAGKPRDDEWGVVAFSDGVLFYIKEGNLWAGLLFITWLTRLAELMVRLHSDLISVRGAVTVGEAWPVKGGSLCGPLIDQLDRMEKDSAFYSRIIASHQFEEYISDLVELSDKSEKVDNLFFLVRDLFDADIDGILMLDILSVHMLNRLKAEGRALDYLKRSKRAATTISDEANGLSENISLSKVAVDTSTISWKYHFLDAYYGSRSEIIDNAFEQSSKGTNNVIDVNEGGIYKEVGEYLVCYFRIEKMRHFPDKYHQEYNYDRIFDTVDSGEDTAILLQSLIAQLHLSIDSWKKDPKRLFRTSIVDHNIWPDQSGFERETDVLSVGVEQIGNYLLFYVRNDCPLALLFFVSCVQMVSVMTLDALIRDHVVMVACTLGNGWEIAPNQLMGPCIGEAHKLTNVYAFYPRIVMSPALQDIIARSRTCITFFGSNEMYPIVQDVDGVYFWDYLSEINKALFESRSIPLDFHGAVEFVYTRLSRRMGFFAKCARRKELSASKVRPMLVLQFYLQEKLNKCGVNCDAIKEQIIEEMDALHLMNHRGV